MAIAEINSVLLWRIHLKFEDFETYFHIKNAQEPKRSSAQVPKSKRAKEPKSGRTQLFYVQLIKYAQVAQVAQVPKSPIAQQPKSGRTQVKHVQL
jgi:hypothetical protein